MKKKITFFIIFAIFLFISYNLVSRIYSALKAGDRLKEAQMSLTQVQIKNQKLKEELKSAASADFIEQQARDKLNFAREGETVVVIPQSKIEQVLRVAKQVEERLPNWLGWLKVFFK